MIGEKIVTINSFPDVDDIVIYFESSGPHTNGYSLIRKCVEKYYPDVPCNVMCELSQPHRNYLSEVRKIHELSPNIIKGMCHITGGGVNNINRILDDSLCIHSEVKTEPDWCQWIREKSHMSEKEMYETFNMGIGFLVIIDKNLFTILENNNSDIDYKYYGKVSKKKQ
jgi:phosphoribosylformylglycinamidine cyclo-ligase